MNANNIYTRKTKYLDNGVWRLMIGTIILSLGLLSFLWANSRKCIPFSFKISPSTDSIYYIGQPLSFEASTKKRNISWDFGDSTNEASEGFITFHTYTRAGNYHVRAIIESGCDTEQVIKVIDSLDLNAEAIKGNGYTIPGKEEEYTCTKEFKTIKWQVSGYPGIKPVVAGKTARFRFIQPGTYTIQATLDDDRTKYLIKGVTVNGNIPSPKPSPVDFKPIIKPGPIVKEDPIKERVIVTIAPITFMNKLKGVLNDAAGKYSISNFDQYLSGGADTRVKLIPGEIISFAAFYNKINAQHSNISIDKVDFKRDPEDNKKIIRIDVNISYN